jgi:hypothetical protein
MRKNGRRLVIDGNAVYEIDETCMECRQKQEKQVEEKLQKLGNRDMMEKDYQKLQQQWENRR